VVRNLLDAGDFEALAHLDRAHETLARLRKVNLQTLNTILCHRQKE
jgi:hypothetical protein